METFVRPVKGFDNGICSRLNASSLSVLSPSFYSLGNDEVFKRKFEGSQTECILPYHAPNFVLPFIPMLERSFLDGAVCRFNLRKEKNMTEKIPETSFADIRPVIFFTKHIF